MTSAPADPCLMEPVSYERLISTSPQLIWATDRSWSAEEAREVPERYNASENTTWRVAEGSATLETADGRSCRVEGGQWLFMGPGMRRQSFHGPIRFLSIGLRWRWPNGVHLFERGLPRIVADDDVKGLHSTAARLIGQTRELFPHDHQALMYGTADLTGFARLAGMAGEWAAAFAGVMNTLGIAPDLLLRMDPRIDTVFRLIGGHPLNRPLAVPPLVVASGLSERQLNRLLQEHAGVTLREAFDKRRYEHARDALLQPGPRIKEVAAGVGFSDLAAFNRWFQRRAGLSPRAFRESFQG